MMKTRTEKIIDLVMAKKLEINKPDPAGAAAAESNKQLAIAAVTGGIKSPAWETYMNQFVSNGDQEQLMRLLATDGSDANQGLIDNRAYLVSNGVCGQGTRARFDENVRTLDKDLETDCEPVANP
jgi:hypothetical protein